MPCRKGFVGGLDKRGAISLADGVLYQMGDIPDVQFAEDIVPVVMNRADANAQMIGNLFARFSSGDEL